MSLQQPLFINQFQKGSEESANIGFGAMVGVENYSKKGVAQLTKDSTKVSGSVVTDMITYFVTGLNGLIYAQGNAGKVYSGGSDGSTWTDITVAPLSAGHGNGLVYFFQPSGTDYLFAFGDTTIDYWDGTTWHNWKTGLVSGGHFAFTFPNDGFVYFTNGNMVGRFGFGTSTTFNPAGSSGTDYSYTASQLTLPTYYIVNCMSFLPTNYIALGTSGLSDNQIADIILWNPTLSTYETPLRLFSQAGSGSSGVNQIINRNNVLYAVTGGNHAIFSTNGTSFSLVDDVSLHTTGRFITNASGGAGTGNTNGIQATAPIFISQYPGAIAVLGNKLYTATGTSISSLPTGYGNFPLGVWSEAFLDSGTALQCEFSISTGTICSTNFHIGSIYPLAQNQLLIGWQDGSNFGIDRTEYQNFQNDPAVVWIESEMTEIGTPLEPAVITTIQENLVRSLILGQSISVYWRTAFDQPYTLLETFDAADGDVQLNNSLKTLANAIGATKFLQLKLSMATGGSNLAWTPELRTIIVTGK